MNCWIYRNDSNITKINSPFDVQQGIEVMLFYVGFHSNENPISVSQEFQRQFSSQLNNSNFPNFSNSNNRININNLNNMNMPNNSNMQMNNNQFNQYNQRSSSGNIFLKKGK